MQFTRLRLQGFKSFVDSTELVIAPGLTGVVGPNGCGKSNLLEALRWVMGETSAKAMRGDGMEDVIFAGASTRPARSYAEVAIHIDNSDFTAPAEFNKTDQLDIIRRITRDAGSAFRLNGKELRARDVRMLFADASTGAHSPALVRQGRISELINAKPKARRAILEEAAGIGGLYQRRHEAELKLRAAEDNLLRVSDVLEKLDVQLAQLARQAKQAARYREIAAELRGAEGLLLWLRWREAAEEAEAARARLREATAEAARAEGEAAARATARLKAEEALPPLREEDVVSGAILQRQLVERDQIDERLRQAASEIGRLEARGTQLSRDLERESSLGRDADESVGRLDWEEKALQDAQDGHPARIAEAAEAARAATAKVEAEEGELDRLTGDAARLAARHQSARRLAEETAAAARKAEAERARAEAGAAELAQGIATAEATLTRAAEAAEGARARAAATETALAAAEAERAEAHDVESAARAEASSAQGEASALKAEADALDRMLARDKGAEGQLLDRIEVAPGHEAALGAALGEDLRAPEITPGKTAGAGWRALDAYPAPGTSLPEGAEPLAPHVKAPAALARRLAHIGIVAQADGDRLQGALAPGQRLVSREGDLWRWDGWRAGAGDAPSAAALRLQQRNRLAALRAQLQTAEAAAAATREAHAAARARLTRATEADAAARTARRGADSALAEAEKGLGRAEGDLELRRARHAALVDSLAARAEEADTARAAAAEAEAAIAALDDLDEVRAAAEAAKSVVAAARTDMLAARAAADERRREGEARLKRLGDIVKERAGWHRRKESAGQRVAELEARIAETAEELARARTAPEELETRRHELVASISKAEIRCKTAGDALAAAEAALRDADRAQREAERAASEAREGRARLEAVAEAAVSRVAEAAERIEEELDCNPQTLAARLSIDAERAPRAEEAELAIIELRRKRDALGAVNLRAEEDAKELQAERDMLDSEKTDLEAAIAKLRQGVASLNSEGRKRLLTAFDEVNASFAQLFTRLFGGGQANLVLVESDDPLDAGLEIMCMPPGKKLSTLSLLSGGEQTLTALSLIFAVFLANPSPICVLDEVDAPLDDANVTRFCDLLDEMRSRTDTRFLCITHHAVTMARMDRLFGVTMAEQGVSQLVSVDLEKAEALVEG
ncbi:MAG: chromosome segregation protein SMC [Rhodobacteraceae bacterium]|nr:chromosome segregation protein SMC [Paracoccaceae bacterium]